ncbi:MAG: hypothetical protein P8Y75_02185 [Nitrospirota bacterium]|jgi:hypothetical protein
MRRLALQMSLVFSAGALGGLINGLAVWFFGRIGFPEALGVSLAPALTVPWLYPRLVWGGIWGALFLIPLLRRRPFWRGVLYGFGPTLGMLFWVFPLKLGKGTAGLDLGALTPLFVILYNSIWGVVASYWLRLAGEERRP